MPHFIGHIEKILENSDSFIDIGSHSGMYLDIAKKYMRSGIVYAFEPNLYRIPLIKRVSLFLKNYNLKIKYIKKVVSNKAGKIKLYKDTISIDVKPNIKPIEVESVILDDYLKEKKIKIPNVIKIDVEGGEFSVLKGCKNIIANCKTHFFVEIHDQYLKMQGIEVNEILDFFDEKKYNINLLYIKDGKPLDKNYFENEIDNLKSKGNYVGYLKPGKIIRKSRISYVHFEPKN